MDPQAPRPVPVLSAILIRVGSGKIWKALTTKEGLEGWFVDEAKIRVRRGGRLLFSWKDWGPDQYTGQAEGTIETVQARRRFAFRWRSHPNHPETLVDINLQERGPITVVRLEETGFGENVAAAMANASGWGEALALLKFYVEHGLRY